MTPDYSGAIYVQTRSDESFKRTVDLIFFIQAQQPLDARRRLLLE